jgi:hypothetical protein
MSNKETALSFEHCFYLYRKAPKGYKPKEESSFPLEQAL